MDTSTQTKIRQILAGHVVLDEFSYYAIGADDCLKEDLRKIEGVPNATYLVSNERVFVFEKLVELVKDRQKQPTTPQPALADLALSLMSQATVTAKEAVELWGIVPQPYEVIEAPSKAGFLIRHRPFNARLPGVFNSSEVRDVLISLLLGGVQSGNGDFIYRDQPMTLCDPVDPALLPLRPAIQLLEEESERSGCTFLSDVAYEPGFPPVSRALFDDVKVLESTWATDKWRVVRFAQGRTEAVWARAGSLRLERLNDPAATVPEHGLQEFVELRSCYPELSMLLDGSLYECFESYQIDCCYIGGWSAVRDDDFLFYLLGRLAGFEREAAKETGRWIAYALLRGDSLDVALAFGRSADTYGSAISALAHRIATAMDFLADDANRARPQGFPIRTTMDIFRLGRKFNGSVSMEQSTTDFGVPGAEFASGA